MLVKLLIGLLGVILVILVLAQVRRRLDAANVEEVWAQLAEKAPRGEAFTTDMVDGLPEPARRYLLRAIRPGTPLASGAEFRMRGLFRLSPDSAWMSFTAEQRLAPPRGFVWRANVGDGLLRFSGADHYFEDRGAIDFWFWGLVPVARDSNFDVSRSSLGRLVAESLFVPSSLLTHRGAAWEAVDANCARVMLEADPEKHSLNICVDEDGDPVRLWLKRWGNPPEGGEYAWVSFGGQLGESREFSGHRIPTRFGVGWRFGEAGYFEFIRAEILSARFF